MINSGEIPMEGKMKKVFSILITSMMFSSTFAQGSAALKLGMFDPGATDAGFILGYEGQQRIDERFAIGWSVDWFNKNYVDKNLVREFDDFFGVPNSELNELRAKTNLHSIPLMFTVTGYFPIAYRTKAFATAGFGAEMLLIFYNDYTDPNKDEFHAAFAFNWRLGGGILYEISSRTDGFIEIGYHGSEPSWTFDVTDNKTNKKRTFERTFDMSGLLMRVGMRFFF